MDVFFEYKDFTPAGARSYIQENGLDFKFGFGSVSGDFLIKKANIIWNLNNKSADISDVVELSCGGYNGAVDDDIWAVLKYIESDNDSFVTNMAKALKLDKNYVELIQYILCGADLCEYGSSPRGCWLTEYGKFVVKKLAEVR